VGSPGVELSERLKELESSLREYYGALNEMKMGIRNKMPPKPRALKVYEQCQELGLPLVGGGVIEQPYIWLQEIATIIEQKTLFEILDERNRQAGAPIQ
jgi:hypothetical protein